MKNGKVPVEYHMEIFSGLLYRSETQRQMLKWKPALRTTHLWVVAKSCVLLKRLIEQTKQNKNNNKNKKPQNNTKTKTKNLNMDSLDNWIKNRNIPGFMKIPDLSLPPILYIHFHLIVACHTMWFPKYQSPSLCSAKDHIAWVSIAKAFVSFHSVNSASLGTSS